jgi:hypothetical protein
MPANPISSSPTQSEAPAPRLAVRPPRPSGSSWSFFYEGVKDRSDVRLCLTCASAADKICARGHGAADPQCSCCTSVATGICSDHSGVVAAMNNAPQIPDHVRQLIQAELVPLTGKIRVAVRGDKNQPESNPSLLHVEILALKG